MSNPLYKARIKKTGKEIEVYKTNKGTYCDYENCSDEYLKHEIIIESKIE